MLNSEIEEQLRYLFKNAEFPPANMEQVVNSLTANSTSLLNLYETADSLLVLGAASPHFENACTIVAQLNYGPRAGLEQDEDSSLVRLDWAEN